MGVMFCPLCGELSCYQGGAEFRCQHCGAVRAAWRVLSADESPQQDLCAEVRRRAADSYGQMSA